MTHLNEELEADDDVEDGNGKPVRDWDHLAQRNLHCHGEKERDRSNQTSLAQLAKHSPHEADQKAQAVSSLPAMNGGGLG